MHYTQSARKVHKQCSRVSMSQMGTLRPLKELGEFFLDLRFYLLPLMSPCAHIEKQKIFLPINLAVQ